MLPAFAQTAAAFDPHTFAYTPYGYKRQREESITKTAELLRVENENLKNEIVQLREMIADLRKQLNSTCQHGAGVEQARDGGSIQREVAYNPYQFQIGFSINSQL
ncbi:unnamed protein product [Angiostrongylus costaricensis]|uniref:Tektin n=1 Tax=Angiostrongylus costaricensis TaxID=334426 RepID=A0A158PD48_ANGCS|nr:unnamed protein product [Angiostrongylus costaricensis]